MGIEAYKSPHIATDIVILTTENKEETDERKVPTKGLQVLLIKRDKEPYKDKWVLPGGFVNIDKGLEETVNNKLLEKTGLSNIYKEQLRVYGDDIGRDPRGRVVSIVYMALINKNDMATTYTQAGRVGNKETAWFWVDTDRDETGTVQNIRLSKVESNMTIANIGTETAKLVELGFDHKKILIDTFNTLTNKGMHTDVGFNLIDKEFTIKEIQSVYEAILGKSLYGFRRIIERKVVETGYTTIDVKHRPAKLYRKR